MSRVTDLLAGLATRIERVVVAIKENAGAGEDVKAAIAGLEAANAAIDAALPEIPTDTT